MHALAIISRLSGEWSESSDERAWAWCSVDGLWAVDEFITDIYARVETRRKTGEESGERKQKQAKRCGTFKWERGRRARPQTRTLNNGVYDIILCLPVSSGEDG